MTLKEFQGNPALVSAIIKDLESVHWKAYIDVLESLTYSRQLSDTPIIALTGNGDTISGIVKGEQKVLKNLREAATQQIKKHKPILETYQVTEPTE